jgi:hypothetical protein
MPALPLGRVSDPGPARTAAGSPRLWRALAIGAVLLAAAVSVAVAWGADRPSFPYDEIDQLQMGRLLAGGELPKVTGAGYYPLWSFLLVPLWWLAGGDAFAVYAGAIAVGVFVGLLAIVPLARLARRMRLSASQATVAAALTVTMPSVALQADYAMSERVLFLMMALTVLTAWRLWERPGTVRAVVFGATVGLLYFTHVRLLAVVVVAGLWLVLFLLHHVRAGLIGLGSLAVASTAAHLIGRELNVRLLGGFTQGDGILDTLLLARPGLLVRSGLGQAWTQVVGTFGLAPLGLVILVVWSWRELRRLRAGRATFTLGVVLALALLATVKWASDYHLYTGPWRRLDTWLYGRYIDPASLILVVIAAAVIIRTVRRGPVIWAAGFSVVIIAPSVLWLSREAPIWAFRTPAHVPGIMPWWGLLPEVAPAAGATPSLATGAGFWLVASTTTLAALVALFVLRRRTPLVTIALLLAFAAASIVADGASNEFREAEGNPPGNLPALRAALSETDASVQFDWGCQPDGSRSATTGNYFGYWLLPTVVETINTAQGDVADADLLISCNPDEGGVLTGTEGRTEVPGTRFRDRTVWVLPGELADRLAGL